MTKSMSPIRKCKGDALGTFLAVLGAIVVAILVLPKIFPDNIIQKMAKPRLPMTVTKRDSLLGQGLVAVITSESDKTLVIDVVTGKNTGASKELGRLVLEAGKSKEIGWAEGWQFESGDWIILSHQDYHSVRFSIE